MPALGAADYRVPAIVPVAVARFVRAAHLPVDTRCGQPGRVTAPFADVVSLFERLARSHRDALREFAAFYMERVPVVSYVASHALSRSALYRLLVVGWSKVWPVAFRLDTVGSQLIVRATAPEDGPDCTVLFGLVTLILERCPRLVDGGDAKVSPIEVGPHAAAWSISIWPADTTVDGPDPDAVYATVAPMVHNTLGATPDIPDSWQLTPSEARVVTHLAAGRSVTEIARVLGVGRETVRTLLKRAMAKAGVHRQVELVLRVRR